MQQACNMHAILFRDGCLPSCELHSRSLTVRRKVACRSWDCAHVVYAISRLRKHVVYAISRLHTRVTQSWDCLRNLGILWMCNTISRLHKFPDCAEHTRDTLSTCNSKMSVDYTSKDGEKQFPDVWKRRKSRESKIKVCCSWFAGPTRSVTIFCSSEFTCTKCIHGTEHNCRCLEDKENSLRCYQV